MTLLKLQKRIVYGPIESRRLGRSLGINLSPTTFKLCSLNCSYCQYGWTKSQTNDGKEYKNKLPNLQEVVLSLREAFSVHKDFEYITFSGNGEPTLHPDFPEIVDVVLAMRAHFWPHVKLAILSNSTTCGTPDIRKTLEKLDLPIMKLDVGNEQAFKRMNHGMPPVTLEGIVAGLKSLNKFVIQTMFVRGKIDNSSDWEVKSWIKRLEELKPLWVQIYTLDRGAASEQLERVELSRLNEIAQMAEAITGVQVEVYERDEAAKDLFIGPGNNANNMEVK
jgi:wyosine [tRNA(Phe)-imidazoG37] synthetase (radical SAM superfamily)